MKLSRVSIIEENKPNKRFARYCVGSVSVSGLRANSGVVLGTCDDETSAELTIAETGQHANCLLGAAILGDKRGVAVGRRTQCYRSIEGRAAGCTLERYPLW